uniref:Photosystem II Psb31 protein domain-containing protein n=1 Tax=Rhizochromulina marina TaxID=1034831 RepID=A0A7S2S7V4_9STRA
MNSRIQPQLTTSMFRVVALVLALFSVAHGFAPAPLRAAPRSVVMSAEGESRRDMLVKGAGALGVVFSGASAAFADGAVSLATVARARGLYGGRIAALSDSVNKGDLEAVEAEKNAFILFNSGVYARNGPVDRKNKKVAVAATNSLFDAVSKGDKAGVKSAYAEFMKVADIQPGYSGKDKDFTQGYSTEYDWKYKDPKKGSIYIR